MPTPDAVRFFLRGATAACHERVDRAFSRFDLGDPASYRDFLVAHARVLLPLEAALDARGLWLEWAGREALLRADLAAIGCAVPLGVAVVVPENAAQRWGMLYVLEGSRLGGAMLARRVAVGLPTAYLGAAHRGGSWARFGAAIDAAGAGAGPEWRAALLAGAVAAFAAFEAAAGSMG